MARTLAVLHVAYGILALGASGWLLGMLFADPKSAGGCCGGSFAPLFEILFGTVFVLALPQLLFALMFLRGHVHGALLMTVLSGINLLINLATATLVVVNDGGTVALSWLPFVAVNVMALLVFPRAIGAPDRA